MAPPNAQEIQYQLAHIHQDRSSDIVVSHSICIVIAAVAVALRFSSRRLCKAPILADDYMTIVALILAAAEVTGGLMCVHYGGGKHAVLLKNPETFAKWVIATEELYNAAITAVKLSILLLYRRLFPDPRFKIALCIVGSFVFCCGLTMNLLVVFQCRPINASWNLSVQGQCIHLNTAFIILGSLNALTDIIALCLPMPFLWRLHADKAKKLQLIGVFSLGSLTCGVSLYRIPQMANISLSDAPWSDVKPCVWAVVEVCLGVLGACLPTFPALFRWKSVRNSRRPSGMSHSKSTDSSQYPVLTPDERRSGFRSGVVGVGKAQKEFLKMIDWADIPKAVEKGSGTCRGMIERAVGWLHTGERVVLRDSKKHLRSRRHLHSAFWSHGAGNIDLPSWWMLFLQNSGSAPESCSSKRHENPTTVLSSGLQEIFLDFLYPVRTLALIRRLERSTNAQHRAAQNIKHCSRSYTSIAADFINGVKAVGTATGARAQDSSTRSSSETPQPGDAIRVGINEMLNLKDHTWVYDELWQSYQALLEMSQSLSPQELIKMLRCLGTSKRTIDGERAVALFDSIPVNQRRAIHYSYAVSAALSLKDLDTAVDIHREALARINGSIGTAAVLRYTVQHENWQLAIDTWHAYWVDRLHYYTRPDIWTGVNALSLPDLMEKAISAADFAISTAESSQHENAVAARDFAIELIRQIFCIQNTKFDIHKHWLLVQKAKTLDSSDMTTQTMALEQLLSVNSREHGHRALNLYRILRKEPTFLPSEGLLSLVTRRLLAEKSSLAMSIIVEDWHTYRQRLPAGIALEVARVFAQLGQLEPLQNLFRDFCSTHGRFKNIAWYHILLFVHNRRADPEAVVRAFNDLQKDFHIKPTLRAWNYVIGTFSRIGDVDGALSWFNQLLGSELRPDSRTYSLLMSMYAKRGDWETVYDFYQQSKTDSIKTSMLMIDSIVLANINDDRLAEAEQLVKEALHMDLKGSRTFMWTILLNAYALRKEVEKVSELHKQMQNSSVASDGMTYAALMTSLTIAKMPQAAYKILDKVMPRAQIKRTSLHYAIVMGGYLATENYGKIFEIYKHMLMRNLSPTMSTQNILLRAAASVDKANQDVDNDPEIQTELVRAQQTFEQTISHLDPMELAASEPRKFVGPNPLNESFSSTYFEYLIFLHGKDAAFSKVTELYERYISTSARFSNRDVEASPPLRLLSALMVAHLRAGDHEEVERCWYLALDKSEKLACRANAVTSEPGWVLDSRRLIMNVPLRQYISSLSEQGRIDDLISTINQLHSSGFALNSPNWNHYIQHLAQSPEPRHQLLAFELCERELISNWPGWGTLGDPNYVKIKLRAIMKNTLHLPNRMMPAYLTLVHLAAVYVQAKQGIRLTPLRSFSRVAPKTVEALSSMPRMADKHQITLLRR